MGIFDSFFAGSQCDRERENEKMRELPVKLVEPSEGRIVELQVTEPDELMAEWYMNILTAGAERLKQYNVKWVVTGNTICFVYPDGDMAENARETWRE